VYCCVRQALLEALENAQAHGNKIKLMVLKVKLTVQNSSKQMFIYTYITDGQANF
jgi:hypothetical protein